MIQEIIDTFYYISEFPVIPYFSSLTIWLCYFTEPTAIITTPEDKTVNATNKVVFKCDAITDPLEEHNLEIYWEKDGERIQFPHRDMSYDRRVSCTPDLGNFYTLISVYLLYTILIAS